MNGEIKTGMRCVECEALLAEALDGTLQGATREAFEAHRASCAACTAMVAEAAAGMHWMKGLAEAEPPHNLVHNILAQTIGTLPETNVPATPRSERWLDRLKGRITPLFAPVVTPRFAMSFGMAFFSITMLLNVAGYHLSDLRHVDLSAKGLTRTYYSTQTRVVRYYENIRLVYEIESRVRDLRRAATPEKQEETTPTTPRKGSSKQEQYRKYENYSRDNTQPVLARCPEMHEQVNDQARLNRRTA